MNQIKILIAVLFFCSVAAAADTTFNPANFTAKTTRTDRKPASSCFTSTKMNGIQVLAMADYSKCSSAELVGLRDLVLEMIGKLGAEITKPTKSPDSMIPSIAFMGAAKASLALIDAQIAR